MCQQLDITIDVITLYSRVRCHTAEADQDNKQRTVVFDAPYTDQMLMLLQFINYCF